MLELTRTLRDAILELCLMRAHGPFGTRELRGHVVERSGELIEFAHATLRNARGQCAGREVDAWPR